MSLLNPRDTPTDEELLARSLAGEPELFGTLVARYERRIYGLLWRLCVDRAAMDDVYQQVWLRAWAGRISFQGRSKFGTWLYSVALNEARSWRRSRREAFPLDLAPEPAASGPSALDRLLGWARHEAVSKAIAGLKPVDRETLALRYQAGLADADIAELTGTNPAQVRLRSFRALKRLKESLKDRDL